MDSKGVRTSTNGRICANILNFDNLRENLTSKLTLENWFLLTSHQHVHIFNVDKKTNGNLTIRNTIFIDTELMAKVYDVNDETLFSVKLCSWPQLDTLIEQFNVKQGGDIFIVSVIDESQLAEAGGEVKKDYGIDQETGAVSFEFCATNGEVHDSQTLLSSLVKIEPTDDTLDWQNTFVPSKNKPEAWNELTVEQDRLELGRQKYPVSTVDQHKIVTPKNLNITLDHVTRKCTICDKDFSTKKKYRNHMYLHDRSKFKECDICNATCFNMRRHIESVHKNVKKDVCHICGAAYKQLSSLKGHMAAKHIEFGEFFCDICKNGKNYRTKAFMKAHIRNVHIREMQPTDRLCTKFECKWCHKQLSSKYALKGHVDAKHSDEKRLQRFHCTTCDKAFKRKQALTNHEILHSGKKFDCTECGRSFNHPDYLAKHRKLHNEIK